MVSARSQKLGVPCLQGCEDKRSAVESLAQEVGLSLQQIAFVGNDINDLPALSVVGLPIVVADAHPHVLPVARSLHGSLLDEC